MSNNLSPAMQKMMAIPNSPRSIKEDAVRDGLALRFGDGEFKLNDVLNECRKQGLPPFKTRDRMLKWGRLKFVGKHRGDQRYKVS